MQPCSAPAPALAQAPEDQDHLVVPCPNYISYTAQLLLTSSTLLAQVGSRAGMDQSRPAQSHDDLPSALPDWQHSLEDPPTSRWANVRVARTDWHPQPESSAAPSCSPELQEKKKKKKPGKLEALIRRRQDDNSSVPPRSLSPPSYHPTQESPRSAPAAQTSYPRCISGPVTMPSGAHPERRPSPLRVPHSSGRNYTTQAPTRTASSDYPLSPQYFSPVSPLDRPRSSSHASESLRSPRARTYPGAPWESSPHRAAQEQRRPSTTFDDDAELHQFAEATSGFDPFSPVRQRPLSQSLYREYYAPRASQPPQTTSYSQPIPQHPFQDRAPGITRSTSASLAQALRAMEEEEYGMPPEDEELPDYAQSQWEAQSHQRRAAARRAAELERQWMEARQRRGSR
ncbi:Histone-lysine n-methyltransferase 2d isoform x1 [Neofusicoccum parvum]|uniref:Histone-lysine n-methyltransferase 2d isoform x1 n=1 Tax=Neofusicoccum parvum TaxID=310453 RepID=A0ACB5RXA4_9PEZI|nr:Histone-lysine n-methyltransferase 2d isoform x1 [Neofusicoccum parvum]GME53935.1 Histone-lysine n-methyltransferase 2d isoform x1 [Neofusicoccum parvum]